MKQNLGKLDRIFRFVLAIWWLGPWALRYNILWLDWVLFVVGWIALLESFTGYCWLHDWFSLNNKSQ